jgi:hypothetical protein
MSSPLFVTTKQSAVENAIRRAQTRRTRPLPALAGKLAEDAAALQESLRLFEHRMSEEDERVIKLLRVAFGDKVEKTLKNHPSLSDEDRAFLRERKGWRV